MPLFVFLWTDIALFVLLLAAMVYAVYAWRTPTLRATWRRVTTDTPAMCSAVVLGAFLVVGTLDSIHFRPMLPPTPHVGADASGAGASTPGASGATASGYSPVVVSVLEAILAGTTLTQPETRFSAPLATRQFVKESILTDEGTIRDYRPLAHGGTHLAHPDAPRLGDILARIAMGAGLGLLAGVMVLMAGLFALARRRDGRLGHAWRDLKAGSTSVPLRAMMLTATVLFMVIGALAGMASGYHALGTSQTGNDVLWQALRSIRTALVIGSLTTVAMLPPALLLGIAAGYFKGRIDDVIQYVYTTLTSIPGVLLVAACVLLMQTFIDTHPDLFPTSAQRADVRLFMLCMILGLTGWAPLCRLLRAETLKLRELDYIHAAKAFGVSHWTIMWRHLLPNVMHIVLITVVLEFSSLVLYEAVLSYLGIGVDPSMMSFGSMIDASRVDMSRDPMVWWSLLTAFVFMLALVLPANLFADGVRAAFDPRSRAFRIPRRAKKTASEGRVAS